MTHTYLSNAVRLHPGNVANALFDILIDISPIRSEKVICALRGYFVEMKTRNEVCDMYCVNSGYLSTKIKELQLLNNKLVNVYPYYSHFWGADKIA